MEQAAAHHQLLGRLLDVQDAATGGHPLRVAVGDQAAATVGVLVPEHAVDDVRHGLKAAVRMPGRALRLAWRVVDLAHLVHMNEGVERLQVNARERAADREALALERRWRGRDRQHLAVAAHCLVRLADPGQQQDVLDCHGWHGVLLCALV